MIKESQKIAQIAKEKLNKVIIQETKRANGTTRIQQDFSNCPTLAEQHTAHLSDLNYLIQKYKPDELAAYIAARSQYRQEIVGHDFSKEPSLQDALNMIHLSKNEFENLPEEIRVNFKSHLEFIKFLDNPANAEKMTKMGILTKQQIDIIALSKKSNKSTEGDSLSNTEQPIKKGKTPTKTQDEEKE